MDVAKIHQQERIESTKKSHNSSKGFFSPKVQGSRMVFYKFIKVTCLAAHTVCCRGNSCILTLRIARRLFLITANLNAASGLHHVQADKSMVVHLMKLHSTFTFEAAKNILS